MTNAAWLHPTGTARVGLAKEPDPSLTNVTEVASQLDLGEAAVFVAWELAALAPRTDRRALTLMVLASLANQVRGSTRLPLTGRRFDAVCDELRVGDGDRVALRRLAEELTAVRPGATSFASLVGDPGSYRPLVVDGGHLYHQRMWELEVRVARRLVDRLRVSGIEDERSLDRLVDDVEADPPRDPRGNAVRLSREQRQAVKTALAGRIAIISGGPGTGKTSIVVSILRALARRGDVPLEQVALAAPTGKAADRMRTSIAGALRRIAMPALADRALVSTGFEASTLHRLLGYSPRSGRFRHHERNRLAQRFVVVDESSMIDLDLMDRLLAALDDEAQLVLLGDARQLPSVEAGAVFRDLSERESPRAVRLTRSYRMDPRDPSGRHVLTVARRIDAGDAEGLFEPAARPGPAEGSLRRRSTPSDIRFEGAEWIDPGGRSRDRAAALTTWYRTRIRTLDALDERIARHWRFADGELQPDERGAFEALFTHFERSKVLCLTRGRATGVEAVNAWFHMQELQRMGRRGGAAGGRALLAGEPVLVQRNDYEKGLFNGDAGIVVWACLESEATARRVAVFRRELGFVAFPLEAVRPLLDLAWAITVHKAQGSEYEHVAVIVPGTETPLLTRELLYTAVTRSSCSVLFIGSREMLERGVRTALERSSGLGDRIAGSN